MNMHGANRSSIGEVSLCRATFQNTAGRIFRAPCRPSESLSTYIMIESSPRKSSQYAASLAVFWLWRREGMP